jgi:hypothetical protein
MSASRRGLEIELSSHDMVKITDREIPSLLHSQSVVKDIMRLVTDDVYYVLL